jgi:flagellar basal-body rod modification protein FlgD
MTYISGISQAYTAAGKADKATADTTDKTADKKKNTLGQDDFLTLLVAQLQNQDPLNPSDPTEFTAQLANYSQLEQLFNLNDSMDKLAESQNNSERLSALSMIGKEALVEGSTFTLGEDTVEIGYKVDGTAADIQLHIQDSTGQRVATLHPSELDSGNHFITWQGVDEAGEHLPAGKYTIVVESQSSGEGETVGVSPLIRADVTGVDLGDGGAVLITDVGEFSMTSIHGVYNSNTAGTGQGDGEQTPAEENTNEDVSAATDGAGIVEETESTAQTISTAVDKVVGG